MDTIVDVRCPANPRRLFMRLHRDPDVRINPGSNLLEVACRDCRRTTGHEVLHRYNILGELVETVGPDHQTHPDQIEPR